MGRLDHDTTGLLLLSDDGQFIHRQSSPKWHVPKVYVAETHEPATVELADRLLAGVKLHDETGRLAAERCHIVDPRHIEIVIEQGKYHQVKRMLAAAGNHCVALRRSQIGELKLDALGLSEGDWCYLDAAHLEQLGASLKLGTPASRRDLILPQRALANSGE